ncbi:hypothetical protein Dda_8538 [Drechslerella dactyloides]|uniref:Nucleoside phosphorylase domain-containing protein n=1 Tax=Drechslerella dactyloides TaxID=74499 RepID=A0AAD6NHD3_DREDA|nr:hypothetical protein Dda_8538 [Drechslerella dactyloides]
MFDADLTPVELAQEAFPIISEVALKLAVETKNRAFGKLGTLLFVVILKDVATLSYRQAEIFEAKVETILNIVENACTWPKYTKANATEYPTLEALIKSKSRSISQLPRSLASLHRGLKGFALRVHAFEGLLTLLEQVETISELTPEDLGLDSSPMSKKDNVPGYPPHVNEALYMTLDLHTSCHCRTQHLKMARLRLDATEEHDGAKIPFEVLFPASPADSCGHSQEKSICHETTMLVHRKRAGKRQMKQKSHSRALIDHLDGKELFIGDFCKHLQRQIGICLRFNLTLENSDPILRMDNSPIGKSTQRMKLLQTLTLAKILQKQGPRITTREKFDLAYLLAKSVWQYYGSDWMKNPWTHDDIQFLQEKASPSDKKSGLLSAYSPYFHSDFEQAERSIGEYCPDGVLIHRYPGVLALAILLIEIIQGRPFGEESSQQYDYNKVKQSYKSAWKVMAENSLDCNIIYKDVIKKCLDGKLFKEAPFDVEDPQNGLETRRTILYREIVFPLKHLLALSSSLPTSGSDPQTSSFTELPEPSPVQDRDPIAHANRFNPSMESQQPTAPLSPLSVTDLSEPSSNYYGLEASRSTSPNPPQMMPSRPSSRDDFEIAIICALPLEYDAVTCLVDEFWDEDGDYFGRAADDQNHYTTGRIDRYNVVLALLPGMGKANAASVASHFHSSYRRLQLALLVGICGAVPFNTNQEEILLGDVVISGSVVEYDLGRRFANEFRRKDTFHESLGRASADVRGFIATLGTALYCKRLQARTAYHLRSLQENSQFGKYDYPGVDEDKLFDATCRHKHHSCFSCTICDQCTQISHSVCEEALLKSLCSDLQCDESQLVRRKRLELKRQHLDIDLIQEPMVHFGSVASGDTVMRSGQDRDTIARKEGIIAFEMEGAGVWDNLSCIIIKGVCDYADSHKIPPRLRPWATPLLHRPATHLTAFLLLHELTAILPLFTLFYAFHITHWNPSDLLPAEWVETGHARFKRYVERKGWDAKGWIDSRGLVELAAAYAVVKALMPVRVLVSLWGAPWFARVAVAPVVRLFGRFRK